MLLGRSWSVGGSFWPKYKVLRQGKTADEKDNYKTFKN